MLKKIIATRNPTDKNHDLWWAHTGGGAGNFGVVTRYWFRIQGTNSNQPSDLLPKAPSVIETIELEWQWSDLNEIAFRQLVNNYCNWVQHNSAPGMKSCCLHATLHLWSKMLGKIQLKALVTEPADDVVNDFLQSLQKNTDISCSVTRKKTSWLDFALHPFPDIFSGPKAAFKVKDAFLRLPFTLDQINTTHHYLTELKIPGMVGLATYGGQVNAVTSDATASAQRSAIIDTACVAGWLNSEDEAKSLEWVRKCYSDLFRETGGVPVPGEQTGGSIIAHPDNDLADPAWNKSGVPWYTLYYQDNYPRLQKIKARWDPHDIFRHSLSVERP